MMKSRWLTYVGIAFLIIVFVVGVTSFPGYNIHVPFITLGFALSFVIIGLGEILYKLNKGGKD